MEVGRTGARGLPSHCSNDSPPVLRDLLRTTRTAVGTFRCGVNDPLFRDSGPTRQCLVVFPRTWVWIRHEGARAFLADPTLVTIYNRGQLYERLPASPEGDRCDWFAVSDEVAREIAGQFDPADGEHERPFRFSSARSSGLLYLRARELLRRAVRGELTALELDEAVMTLVALVLEAAYGRPARALASRCRRDLAERTRLELAREPQRNTSVREIADRVGASPFHLCRVFRQVTGTTMHAYRRELRVRLALEPLEAETSSLSRLAHRFGFASHAHFTREVQLHLGATPCEVRRRIGNGVQL